MVKDLIAKVKKIRKERGASLIEYALLAALIAILCIVAMKALGSGISSSFSQVNSGLAG